MLGLGPNEDRLEDSRIGREDYPSILEQLKKDGSIGSTSYSVQVGSVKFDQPGSLVLGGYDQSRVMGRAGVFPLPANEVAGFEPLIPLLDMSIGVETGGSPFGSPDPISVFVELGSNGFSYDVQREGFGVGGPRGTAPVMPDPTVPYFYLPPGNCEKIAKHLPVSHNSDLDLYLWNTGDPQFDRIVNSPAYLSFVFWEDADRNTTIKVPFRLLNLTLNAPLVDKPTAYFPCKTDTPDVGSWSLGRAFLQAAFFAIDYDANRIYLGQAPGPRMAKSTIKEMVIRLVGHR